MVLTATAPRRKALEQKTARDFGARTGARNLFRFNARRFELERLREAMGDTHVQAD
jgi:hypothetical protein